RLAAAARRAAVEALVATAAPYHDRAALVAARGVLLVEEGRAGRVDDLGRDGLGHGLQAATSPQRHGGRQVGGVLAQDHPGRDLVVAREELRGQPAEDV